jgi:hypothetical protein
MALVGGKDMKNEAACGVALPSRIRLLDTQRERDAASGKCSYLLITTFFINSLTLSRYFVGTFWILS